jgi:uncharacterized membrane protein
MAQGSVFAQTTLSELKRTIFTYKWMRHFFTEDQSPQSRPIVDWQQRAVWIALALLLQSANEINRRYYAFLGGLIALVPLVLFLGSFYALWRAMRPAKSLPQGHRATAQQPQLWQRIVLILTALLTIGGFVELGLTITASFLPPLFSNDGTALDANAAILLTQGRNPYTDSNMPELLRQFYILPSWTTPLREGQLANRLNYPSNAELQSVLNTSLKAGDVPEFEAKTDYPALSFLTLMPFVMTGNHNVLLFYLFCYGLLVVVAWSLAHPEIRPWIVLLAIANVPMLSSVRGGNLDLLYVLFIVLAWWLRNQRWSSAVYFGLAMASKQIAWYFAPFYLIMTWRTYGFKEAIYRMAIASGLSLLINLPFIMWDWKAWSIDMLAPMSDPMFPLGVGLINLSATHLLPYLPQTVYTLLEGAAMLFVLAWYWRCCCKRPEAAMLLAILPLFFAWRSLPSYFYCTAFPVFIVMAAKMEPISHRALVAGFLHKLAESVGVLSPVSV